MTAALGDVKLSNMNVATDLGNKRRARTEDDKRARRDAIVDSAATLLAHSNVEDLTVARVAQAAGIAKGTAYSYFSSKEALLLAVLQRLLRDWVTRLLPDIEQVTREDAHTEVARAVAATLGEQPTLLMLLSKLHRELEPRVATEELVAFKGFLHEVMRDLETAVEARCQLSAGQGKRFFLRTHVLAIGLGQVAKPSPKVQQALNNHPHLKTMTLSFEEELQAILTALLRDQG